MKTLISEFENRIPSVSIIFSIFNFFNFELYICDGHIDKLFELKLNLISGMDVSDCGLNSEQNFHFLAQIVIFEAKIMKMITRLNFWTLTNSPYI